MLEDILGTRIMVKNSMKIYKTDTNLLKILDSRQLSLKLIANVTFGYTAANFSGRMPCVEIGDTIVRVARQTLENSIKYIQSINKKHACRVVYGDTDSLFVLFEKIPKADAFTISMKLVNDITNMNPKPVKLKFEKIYLPSVLLAQKRYLGNMFETSDQLEPVLEAKGVELVRRDGCQIAAKMLERCCKILFEFKDVERVKDYLVKQIHKLVNSKINLKEFIIAKEYRGRSTYANPQSIAACQVANKALSKDPLAEPLSGERVPYVIVYGMPGVPLYELVRSPYDLIENPDLRLNYEYYVMKQILPPLDRIFLLMKVNVFDWVKNFSFKQKLFNYQSVPGQAKTISNYIFSTDCVLCGRKRETSNRENRNKEGLCAKCGSLDQNSLVKLLYKLNRTEKRVDNLMRICMLCTSNLNVKNKTDCVSLDCPNTYMCINAKQDLKKTDYIRKILDQYF
jgi:DNA polymerase zeta